MSKVPKTNDRPHKYSRKVSELDTDREPHERQSWESNEQWLAFVQYRDMGINRSLSVLGAWFKKEHGLNGSDQTMTTRMQDWSYMNNWRVRVASWDRHVDAHRRRLALAEVDKMFQRHAERWAMIQDIVALDLPRHLEVLADEARAKNNPVLLMKELATIMDQATRGEMKARGQPDNVVEARHQINSENEREQLLGLLSDPEALAAAKKLSEAVAKKQTEKNGDPK